MPGIISRSAGRKLAVLLIAIAGFVLLYETRIFDSRYAAWQAMLSMSAPPEPGTTLQFSATAYCKGTTTASGIAVRTGIAAADPALLPVGSVVNVTTEDPQYQGVYTVMDTGPKVQGRILDLYMWSCHEALRFGRQPIQVTVLRLGWDPAASAPTLVDRLFRSRETRREATRRVPAPAPPPPAGVTPVAATADRPPDVGDLERLVEETAPDESPGIAAEEPAPAPPDQQSLISH